MEQSIFNSTKKILGIGSDDTSFDLDILTHINSAFSTLQQMGIGLPEGFSIEDEEPEWADFIEDFPDFEPQLGMIKTFVYLKTRMLFDPPTTSYLIEALNKQLEEQEVRLVTAREEFQWVPPVEEEELPNVLDGGDSL